MSEKKPTKKSAFREWIDSVTFAVVAATLIRFFFFEAYTIPTPSMESSLMVGDFLFVSKLHYGVRTPKTPLQVPLTHQKIWGTDIPSYLNWIDLPIYRLPGFSKPKSGDAVVFNAPNFTEDGNPPLDLRTYYIKRCIGTPGDVVEVRDMQVYLNGKPMKNPVRMQNEYSIISTQPLEEDFFKEFNISPENAGDYTSSKETLDSATSRKLYHYSIRTSAETAQEIKKNKVIVSLGALTKREKGKPNYVQTQDGSYVGELSQFIPDSFGWNADWFGPLTVPKEGMTIQLTPQNIAMYGMAIRDYEGYRRKDGTSSVTIDGNKVSIDGKPITSYTFKQDYYFMMGDNRHNSLDCRFWGFVPFDHVVGKAVFVWMSLDPMKGLFNGKIRWDRIFRTID
ncbi:signal peptidase I [Pseudarcicella hirudinis]|uniref:Signal peptidase I n=1 Tax=Pseudarcicella hirudinis TaxID=1079859 RepID=A0A1I5VAX1_9BACT|nr:signal peptidase I [Pseudarcicella hirudinis]SFQ04541.1 signal peptidase I [Pseudarcicella hirudinis]